MNNSHKISLLPWTIPLGMRILGIFQIIQVSAPAVPKEMMVATDSDMKEEHMLGSWVLIYHV